MNLGSVEKQINKKSTSRKLHCAEPPHVFPFHIANPKIMKQRYCVHVSDFYVSIGPSVICYFRTLFYFAENQNAKQQQIK